tara:strand:- start:1722 stop:2102 length:381 start_codon:yes stop_codon:yes gene_type:complete
MYHFIDRYKYGIKFKFLVSGLMGKFDIYLLISHFVSGVVLINISGKIIAFVGSKYYKHYSELTRIKEKIESDDDSDSVLNDEIEETISNKSNSKLEEINLEIIRNNNTIENDNTIKRRSLYNHTFL